jgi:two-component system CheB/CheR fusion protein
MTKKKAAKGRKQEKGLRPSSQPASTPPVGASSVLPAQARLTQIPQAAPSAAKADAKPDRQEPGPAKKFPIVGIGASAGGLEAFTTFLKALPPDTGMAFVLIQHMDPTHQSILDRLLAKDTVMPVTQVVDGMPVEPNHVYVIPPNTEMTISNGTLRLVGRPVGTAGYHPIDTFLSALAEDQSVRAIGIILSGIASDGTKGLQAIKAEGGITFAQDEESAKYSGMPRHAVAAGCVDLVLPPDKIARELSRMILHPYLQIAPQAVESELSAGEDALRKVLRLLRSSTGVDFSNYKQTTIQRRIARRMLVRRCETLGQYAKYASDHPEEVQALFEDVLIHVTGFFRDPQVFEFLKSSVFPRLPAALEAGEPIRIWVPGCSSGEEVYSIAITLHEALGDMVSSTKVQMFGTDISDTDIRKARAAFYSESAVADVSPDRLRRFFVKVEGGYQIAKPLRELCVFARHDVTKDPPFSHLDLISCRNVLIYFGSVFQKKVLNYFHYALKENGFLILGKSETVSAAPDLFSLDYRDANVYAKIASRTHPLTEFRRHEPEQMAAAAIAQLPAQGFDLRKEAERIILERYAPPAFVINAGLQILHFQGDTSPFLKPVPGESSFSLVKLVRPELMLEIRTAIHEAKQSGAAARHENIRFKRNGNTNLVDLEVVPVAGRAPKGENFVVLLQDLRPANSSKRPPVPRMKPRESDQQIDQLKRDLALSQDNLRAVVEDQEAANEEVRAANEEILSSNEELQSTNEELETAKEELQSSNEELATLNDELQNRNLELSQTASDLNSLLNAVDIPIVILGNDRCIRRFTPAAQQLLNLIPTDIGRPIVQIRPNLQLPSLDQVAAEVIDTLHPLEMEVRDDNGHWYLLRVRPYKTAENLLEGILIAVIDINDVKQLSTAIVETIAEPLLVMDANLRVITANPAFYEKFQVSRAETEERPLFELGNGQWDIPQLRELLERVLPEKKTVENFKVAHEFPSIGRKTMLLNARQLHQDQTGSQKVLLAVEDVSQTKQP